MAQSAVRIFAEGASRIAPRRPRLWPSRNLRLPPGAPPAAEPDRTVPLSAGPLTARELIAMARAARA